MQIIANEIDSNVNIISAGTTGNGRQLAGAIIGADVVKNEITAYTVSVINQVSNAQTIFEISGSFLDQQVLRLGIPIEEFGNYSIKSKSPAKIAVRCTVFAESDMIHKQQISYSL